MAILLVSLAPVVCLAQNDDAAASPISVTQPGPIQEEPDRRSDQMVRPQNYLRDRFFASARLHPLTPQEMAMRESIRALGVNKHRFVRCEFTDGTAMVGAIQSIRNDGVTFSNGIAGQQFVLYKDLKSSPVPVAAPGEHILNGLKWTGLVAACIVLSPVLIVIIPLMMAGVLND